MSGSDNGHQRVVIYWTLHNDKGSTLACELSRTATGLVLRCLDKARSVALTERVATVAGAVDVAGEWKARLLDKGEYFERPRPEAPRPPRA